MKFQSEVDRGIRVIHLEGHWTGGQEDRAFRESFKGWLGAGERRFVIDLTGTGLLSSIGLGGLVACYSSCAREGAAVKLSGMSERHRRAGYVSHILELFEEYPTAAEAVASFGDGVEGEG